MQDKPIHKIQVCVPIYQVCIYIVIKFKYIGKILFSWEEFRANFSIEQLFDKMLLQHVEKLIWVMVNIQLYPGLPHTMQANAVLISIDWMYEDGL